MVFAAHFFLFYLHFIFVVCSDLFNQCIYKSIGLFAGAISTSYLQSWVLHLFMVARKKPSLMSRRRDAFFSIIIYRYRLHTNQSMNGAPCYNYWINIWWKVLALVLLRLSTNNQKWISHKSRKTDWNLNKSGFFWKKPFWESFLLSQNVELLNYNHHQFCVPRFHFIGRRKKELNSTHFCMPRFCAHRCYKFCCWSNCANHKSTSGEIILTQFAHFARRPSRLRTIHFIFFRFHVMITLSTPPIVFLCKMPIAAWLLCVQVILKIKARTRW